MLKQREEKRIEHEQAANLAVQKEQEDQAAQSFTPYWNFPMIDDVEVLQARENLMKAIQTFLNKFSNYPFGVMPKVLSIAWERFFEIKHAFTDKQYQPKDIQELMCKLLEDVRNINDELYLENSSKAPTPVLPTEEPEYSLSMEDEHLSTTLETKSDEIIKSSVENLVPILSEYEGILDDTCDVPICEDSSTLKDHYEILSDSNDDDTSSDDDAFEDIELVEASLLDSELVSLEEVNDVDQEEKEIDLEAILQIQDVILHEKLLSINRLIADIEFLNDNPTPDRVFKYSSSFHIPVADSDSFFEKSDTSLSNLGNSLPEFETFSDYTKETRSGSTTAYANNSLPEYDSFFNLFFASDNSIPSGIENIDYDSEGDIYFLEELLSNDSIPLPENESSNFDHHDDPSFSRPPPEPPDDEVFFDFKPDTGVLTTKVVKGISEHYVIMPNIFPTLSTFYLVFDPLLSFSFENKDKVFKPGILSYLLVSRQDKIIFDFSENPMMMYGGDIP
nr:hypothetical protein [Tanacetum cinerariifolium]